MNTIKSTVCRNLALVFVVTLMTLHPASAQAGRVRNTVERLCAPLLRYLNPSLESQIAYVQEMTGASRQEVNDLLIHHAAVGLVTTLQTQREGTTAFSVQNHDVIKIEDAQLVNFGEKWFYRESSRSLIEELPSDSELDFLDGRNKKVIKIIDHAVEFYSSQETLPENQNAFFFFMDINGLKLINEALPTKSYPMGGHSTGNALLKLLGTTIKEVGFNGILARVGGDEIVGIATFKDAAEAQHFSVVVNEAYSQKIETYLSEQKELLAQALAQDMAARSFEEFSRFNRAKDHSSVEAARKELISTIEDLLFRVDKDRPSLSFGIAYLDSGLISEAVAMGLSPTALVEKETDALMVKAKHTYKLKNGLPAATRDGKIDLTKVNLPWSPPVAALPYEVSPLQLSSVAR